MPSDRVQRQVDRLLDQAEESIALRQWEDLRATCEVVLNLDPDNSDATSYIALADKSLATDVVSDSSEVAEPSEGRTLTYDEYENAYESSEGIESSLREEIWHIFKQLIGTSGRINRCGYAMRSGLSCILLFFAVFFYCMLIGPWTSNPYGGGVIGVGVSLFWSVGSLIFSFSTTVRRFHDFNGRGASVLLLLIPFVNIVIVFMLLFRSGTRGTNDHGDEPVDLGVGF